jgi:hypothetical protein
VLDLNPSTLRYRMKKLHIHKPRVRTAGKTVPVSA